MVTASNFFDSKFIFIFSELDVFKNYYYQQYKTDSVSQKPKPPPIYIQEIATNALVSSKKRKNSRN